MIICMEDLISRQAAIEMIREDLPEVVYYRKEDAIACLECLPAASIPGYKDMDQRLNELDTELNALIKNYAACMKDYAKSIFKELRALLRAHKISVTENIYDDSLSDLLLKLEKKYTEGEV